MRNTGERREVDKSMKQVRERKNKGEGLRYERNKLSLNFSSLFMLMLMQI
jgi:hypothetical protein